jgi:hypothetical protein
MPSGDLAELLLWCESIRNACWFGFLSTEHDTIRIFAVSESLLTECVKAL